MHKMVKTLIHLETDANRNKAWEIIHNLEVEHGERLAESLLKLDLLAAESGPSPQGYSDVLQKIVDRVPLNESNIRTILHHTHRLRSRSPSMAKCVLIHLISKRLLNAEKCAWLEKTLVTVIWYCTSSEIPGSLDSMGGLFDAVAVYLAAALSHSATHAAQILFWKRIELSYQLQQYDISEAWCKLSLHKIFGSSGAMNVGKLQRKLMLCALGQAKSVKAWEIYARMSAFSRQEPSTQYLIYKTALTGQELETALQCLDSICRATTEDATILYACVLEAQKTGNQIHSVALLQRVLERYDYDPPIGARLPPLLRCTARLLIQQVGKGALPTKAILKDICKIFEGTAAQAQKSRMKSEQSSFTATELDWFSRNCYNLALKSCAHAPLELSASLITSCLHFIDLYPFDLNPNVLADLSLRRLFCNYLSGSLSIVRARQEATREIQIKHDLDVRKAVAAFRTHFRSQMSSVGKDAEDDLQQKYTSLLTYDFEAANRLKAWSSLESTIKVYRLLCLFYLI